MCFRYFIRRIIFLNVHPRVFIIFVVFVINKHFNFHNRCAIEYQLIEYKLYQLNWWWLRLFKNEICVLFQICLVKPLKFVFIWSYLFLAISLGSIKFKLVMVMIFFGIDMVDRRFEDDYLGTCKFNETNDLSIFENTTIFFDHDIEAVDYRISVLKCTRDNWVLIFRIVALIVTFVKCWFFQTIQYGAIVSLFTSLKSLPITISYCHGHVVFSTSSNFWFHMNF